MHMKRNIYLSIMVGLIQHYSLFSQALLEEVKTRDKNGSPIEVFYKDDELNIVKYRLFDSSKNLLLEVPYHNGMVHGKVIKLTPFNHEPYETNYINGIINDSNVTLNLITEFKGGYAFSSLSGQVDMGKFNGSVSCEWATVEDIDWLENFVQINNYKYLPNEFLLDVYLLFQGERNMLRDYSEFTFNNGKLINGRLEFAETGELIGLLRKNEMGYIVDSVFTGSKIAMVNGSFVKTNGVALGVDWSFGGPTYYLNVNYLRDDYRFNSLADSIHGGYFNIPAHSRLIDDYIGDKVESVCVNGYRLVPWNGVYLYKPGLFNGWDCSPFESYVLRNRRSEDEINKDIEPEARGNNDLTKLSIITNEKTLLGVLKELHFGFVSSFPNQVINHFGDGFFQSSCGCRYSSAEYFSYSAMHWCKFLCAMGINETISYRDIFYLLKESLESKDYFISAIYFEERRSYLNRLLD